MWAQVDPASILLNLSQELTWRQLTKPSRGSLGQDLLKVCAKLLDIYFVFGIHYNERQQSNNINVWFW